MPFPPRPGMTNPGLKRWHSSDQLHRRPSDLRPPFREKFTAMPNQKSTCCTSCSSLPKQAHPVLTESEFQNLPPSVQRKYFSTLERLQILHYSANVYTHDPPTHTTSRPRTSATATVRPTTSTSFGSSIRRPKNRSSVNLGPIDSKVETHFYLSLPDKIRRQQFSKEEQLRLQSQLEAGSLTIPRSSQGSRSPSTTSSTQNSRRQSNSALCKDSEAPSIDLPGSTKEAMNCFDGSKPTQARSRRMRKSSLQRDASVHRPSSSVFSPKSQFSSPTLCSPSSPSFSHHQRNMSSRTATIVRPSIDSTFSVDAAAAYYQDPEARMKLRKYLASPQKFDEAVAFGFPSMQHRTSTCERDASRPSHSTTSGNDAQHFLKDDVVSYVDGRLSRESSDGDTISYNDSPVTPASAEDIMPRVKPYGSSIFAGLDKSDLPSLRFQFDGMSDIPEHDYEPEPSIFDPLANREMTLRMTLTRPELRATEEELYGWPAKEDADPLALETLNLSDDVTGQNGAFAVKTTPTRTRRSGVFKKLLGRVISR